TRRGPPAPDTNGATPVDRAVQTCAPPLGTAVDAAGRGARRGASRAAAPRGRLLVRAAGSRQRIPKSTEEVLALARDLSCTMVELVQVQRMPLVRHLELAVLPLGGAEQLRLHAGTGADLPLLHERRPERRALPVAGALLVPVLHEQIERPSR